MNRGMEQIASQSLASRLGRGLSEGVVVTLAAQIATTPLIAYYFGRLSIVSLMVNLLVIPAQPPLLLFGALGTLVGLIIPPLGDALLAVAWIFLSWNVAVVEFFADLPWADQEVTLSGIEVWGFVVLLFGAAIYQGVRPRWLVFTRRRLWIRLGTAAAVAALILMLSTLLGRPDGKLHVTYLDGGVLIQSPKGAAILVDGGEFPSRLLDDLGDALPARSRRIEAVIVTAPDETRTAALPEVLERYQVGALLTNGQTSGVLDALLERAEEENVPVLPVSAGYELTTDDGLRIEVLHPLTIPTRETPLYDGSLVLRVTYGEAVFLLTGGIMAESEARLLSQPHLVQATVLQVPSGGSGEASTAPFILTANPQVAVMQLGAEDNPSTAVLDRLNNARLFRTDQDGQIEIVTDGTELWIYAENK
jgi:competence protein ComEC